MTAVKLVHQPSKQSRLSGQQHLATNGQMMGLVLDKEMTWWHSRAIDIRECVACKYGKVASNVLSYKTMEN